MLMVGHFIKKIIFDLLNSLTSFILLNYEILWSFYNTIVILGPTKYSECFLLLWYDILFVTSVFFWNDFVID